MNKLTKKRLLNSVYWALGVLLLLLIWEIIAWNSQSFVFPDFFATLGNMFALMGEKYVWEGLGSSMLRVLVTLAISLVLGALLGLLSAFIPPVEKILAPAIYFLTAFPTAAMIFILIIYTKLTCELLVSALTFPIIYKAALGGGKEIISRYGAQMSLDGRYRPMNFFRVLLPLSLPYLSIGLAQATGLALKAEIMGEVFMSNPSFKGIGSLINQSKDAGEIVDVFSLTLLAILVLALIDLIIWPIKERLKGKFSLKEMKIFHKL